MKKVSTSAVLIFVTGLLSIFLFFLILPPSVLAEQNGKRPLTHEDYDAWKSIASSAISADGQWILYLEVPQDGDGELVVKNIKSAKTFRHAIGYTGEGTDSERAARPQFSYDSNHVVFLLSPSQEEVKEAKKAKKEEKKKAEEKLKKKLGIMSLKDGKVTKIERVKSYALPEKEGGWVAYLKEANVEEAKKEEKKEKKEEEKAEEEKGEQEKEKAKKKKEDYGTPFVLRSLKDGSETTFEDVLKYLFTKNGKFLFYVVSKQKKDQKMMAFIPYNRGVNPARPC